MTALPPFTAGSSSPRSTADAGSPSLLLVAAALYLYGVYRLRLRGDRWPIGRTAAFIAAGLGSIAAVTVSGIEAYDTRCSPCTWSSTWCCP